MLFSIVIPTYNNQAELLACLDALTRLSCRDFEVWVCVDGSTDGTAAVVLARQWGFPLQVLEHEDGQNHGRAAARNLALDRLTGQYVLFLDSDMCPAADLLEAHQRVLEKGNCVSIGAVCYDNERDNRWVRYLAERGVARFAQGEAVPHNYFITPNTALPSEWFRKLRGFDGSISAYGGEDMELGYRLDQRFGPAFVCNRLAVVHTHQEKRLKDALLQLKEYGGTGLKQITRQWPELRHIYWVNRVHSSRLPDLLLRLLLKPFFRFWVRALLPLSPWFIARHLISYLVVAHVHEGFRGKP